MSLLDIKIALETRLKAMTETLPTAWENAAFTAPVTGEAYQRVHFLIAPREYPTLGTRFYRERGIMQVTLVYPPSGGTKAVFTRAEAICAWFPRGGSYVKNSTTAIVTEPSIGPGRPVEGRFMLPISIPYYADVNN